MSEKLVKVLEEEKDRILGDAKRSIDFYRDDAVQRIETRFKELEDAMQTVFPKGSADMVAMMWRGCIFKTASAEALDDNAPLQLNVGYSTIIGPNMWNSQMLKKGKYRITLIIEPKEEKADG